MVLVMVMEADIVLVKVFAVHPKLEIPRIPSLNSKRRNPKL